MNPAAAPLGAAAPDTSLDNAPAVAGWRTQWRIILQSYSINRAWLAPGVAARAAQQSGGRHV